MTPPITSSKVLLVADRPAIAPQVGAVRVRRYRLARLRLEGRPTAAASRYEHLKRVYD